MSAFCLGNSPPQPSPQGGGGSIFFEARFSVQTQAAMKRNSKIQFLICNWKSWPNLQEVAPSPLWGGLGRGFVQTANFRGRHVC